jgi:diguanylate cyclase (GGDEF)-like protein
LALTKDPETKTKELHDGEALAKPLLSNSLSNIQASQDLPASLKKILSKFETTDHVKPSDLVYVQDFLVNAGKQKKKPDLQMLNHISYLQLVYYIRSFPNFLDHFKNKTIYELMRLAMDQRFHFPNQNPEKILNELKKHINKTKELHLNFDDLSAALILAQLQAYDLTLKYLDKISDERNEEPRSVIIILTDLIRALIHRRMGEFAEAHAKFASICIDLLKYQDVEALLYVINEWSYVFYRTKEIQKGLSAFKLIRDLVGQSECRNYAKTLYYLFYITKYDKPKAEKIGYLDALLQIPNTVLQNYELLHVHFYAGNFYSTIQVNFAESIKHFTESNYYLMKSWEQLLQNNAFLENHLPMDELKMIAPIFEYRLKDLLNENSLQINQFVEYLEFAYNEQNKLYDKVQELSLTDTLTGLRNRRFLLNNIPHLIYLAKRHRNPISIIMLDIDDFKKINDIYGHLAGDRILHDLSEMIQPMFRKSDIVLRYGGEEFLIVLFDAETNDSLRLAEELRETIEKKVFTYQDFHIHLTISGGINTHFFGNNETEDVRIEDMIALADHALYYSKKHGKNLMTTCEQLANNFLETS